MRVMRNSLMIADILLETEKSFIFHKMKIQIPLGAPDWALPENPIHKSLRRL
jgi:hypothetical protein